MHPPRANVSSLKIPAFSYTNSENLTRAVFFLNELNTLDNLVIFTST